MTILKKIIDRKLPATVLHEDEMCMAILDIEPQAPTHIILFPKKEIVSLAEAAPDDEKLLGHLMMKASEVAAKVGLAKDGYRLVINTRENGGQSIDHLHIHILGGRAMKWPPG